MQSFTFLQLARQGGGWQQCSLAASSMAAAAVVSSSCVARWRSSVGWRGMAWVSGTMAVSPVDGTGAMSGGNDKVASGVGRRLGLRDGFGDFGPPVLLF